MNKKTLLTVLVAAITLVPLMAQEAIDIWNLPPLSIEQGRYTTDWDNLSQQYNTPAWWREAKLGAWSHWDPQSMAEDGDTGSVLNLYCNFVAKNTTYDQIT